MTVEEKNTILKEMQSTFVSQSECQQYRNRYEERFAEGATTLALLKTNLENLKKTVDKIYETVERQQEQPRKNWEKVIHSGIGAIVGAVVAYILSGNVG